MTNQTVSNVKPAGAEGRSHCTGPGVSVLCMCHDLIHDLIQCTSQRPRNAYTNITTHLRDKGHS